MTGIVIKGRLCYNSKKQRSSLAVPYYTRSQRFVQDNFLWYITIEQCRLSAQGREAGPFRAAVRRFGHAGEGGFARSVKLRNDGTGRKLIPFTDPELTVQYYITFLNRNRNKLEQFLDWAAEITRKCGVVTAL